MPRGFFFDNTRCTGCRTCVLACKDYHDHRTGNAFRMVIDYEGGSWERAAEAGAGKTDPAGPHGSKGSNDPGAAASAVAHGVYAYHISVSCNHCNDPVCTQVCPTGAMHKDELDLVWPDVRKCIGCGYCTMACPYHAPHIDEHLKRSSKCDGCRSRVLEGARPVCVEACPVRALDFGTAAELQERHPGTVRSIMPLPHESATSPNLSILPSAAALRAEDGTGRIVNRKELGL